MTSSEPVDETEGRPDDWPAHLPDPAELARRGAAYLEQRYAAQARRGRLRKARERLAEIMQRGTEDASEQE